MRASSISARFEATKNLLYTLVFTFIPLLSIFSIFENTMLFCEFTSLCEKQFRVLFRTKMGVTQPFICLRKFVRTNNRHTIRSDNLLLLTSILPKGQLKFIKRNHMSEKYSSRVAYSAHQLPSHTTGLT